MILYSIFYEIKKTIKANKCYNLYNKITYRNEKFNLNMLAFVHFLI